MNKAGKWLLGLLWIGVIGGSRVLYFFYAGKAVVDTYGYFELGVQRAWETGGVFWAGLSDAYVWTLSWLFRLMGNRIEIVGVYQLVIQILWMILFFVGISMLLGRKAGYLLSGVLLLLPWILQTLLVVSPENYFMLHFSLFLVILGYFCNRKKAQQAAAALDKTEAKAVEAEKGQAEEGQMEEGQVEEGEVKLPVENEEGYVITEDGRKVKLFDNPLPLPPKHVKKTMGFDFSGTKDDFDYQVGEKDDFDV